MIDKSRLTGLIFYLNKPVLFEKNEKIQKDIKNIFDNTMRIYYKMSLICETHESTIKGILRWLNFFFLWKLGNTKKRKTSSVIL